MIVSICIPAYEDIEGITRLLNSIAMQTFKDFEVVITDDTRDNRIQDVLRKFENKFRIRYKKNKDKLGATANCNEAVNNANGIYIKLMHQDDFFSFDDSLKLMIEMLDKNVDCDLAFTGTYQVSPNEKRARSISDSNFSKIERDYRYLFMGNYIGAPSATIFRNKKFLFDEKLTWLVDVELYMCILAQNNKIVKSDLPLISIGISDRQLTNLCKHNWMLQVKEYFYIYKKHGLYRKGRYTLVLIYIYVLILKDILRQKR